MNWRIHYNCCFYSDVVAKSEDEAMGKVKKVLDLDELFQVNQVELMGEESYLERYIL